MAGRLVAVLKDLFVRSALIRANAAIGWAVGLRAYQRMLFAQPETHIVTVGQPPTRPRSVDTGN